MIEHEISIYLCIHPSIYLSVSLYLYGCLDHYDSEEPLRSLFRNLISDLQLSHLPPPVSNFSSNFYASEVKYFKISSC
jgi:hypothetical protein